MSIDTITQTTEVYVGIDGTMPWVSGLNVRADGPDYRNGYVVSGSQDAVQSFLEAIASQVRFKITL